MQTLIERVAILLIVIVCFSSCEKEVEQNETNQTTDLQNRNESIINELIKEATNEIGEKEFKTVGEVQTVPFVDLDRYVGQWYELAKFPTQFGQGCACTRAEYAQIPGGVSVFNSCTLPDGSPSLINGRAVVVDAESNSKLQVFLGPIPFPGDYWIIDLVGKNKNKPYEFAVVSDPDRENLFILSRTPQIENTKQRKAILSILINLIFQGYDLSKLEITPQPENCIYP